MSSNAGGGDLLTDGVTDRPSRGLAGPLMEASGRQQLDLSGPKWSSKHGQTQIPLWSRTTTTNRRPSHCLCLCVYLRVHEEVCISTMYICVYSCFIWPFVCFPIHNRVFVDVCSHISVELCHACRRSRRVTVCVQKVSVCSYKCNILADYPRLFTFPVFAPEVFMGSGVWTISKRTYGAATQT